MKGLTYQLVNIKELKEKYNDTRPDSVLESGLELMVKVRTPFDEKNIILEDGFGSVEAFAKKDVREVLKSKSESGEKVKLKGVLVKSLFEDICFEIDEVLE